MPWRYRYWVARHVRNLGNRPPTRSKPGPNGPSVDVRSGAGKRPGPADRWADDGRSRSYEPRGKRAGKASAETVEETREMARATSAAVPVMNDGEAAVTDQATQATSGGARKGAG